METSEPTVERIGGYRVVRRLATGGTSEVLLAKAEGPLGFERTVVLKLLLPAYQGDEELAQMFAREAAAYARLSHPSIVKLYDFFALDASQAASTGGGIGRYPGQLVMALEYVDGPTLQRLRGMLRAVGVQLEDRAAMHGAACIFEALAAAHQATDDAGMPAPVIHRDVNPANVLIPWDGHVKLADFGVAKVTGLTHQSAAGLIKGTYGYMAPEQVRGDAVTTRADVYGAGIVLWEMLAHKRAFHRGALPEIEVLRAMEEPRIPSIDSVRPDLDKNVRAALKRALEPSADRRTITAEEMVSVLRAVVPSDQGRERLASALALVRHEPKPKPTSAPPPPEATPIAPRPGAARPTTAAYGSPPKPSSGHIPAAPPVPRVEPPRRPSSGRMRAAPPLPPRAGAPKPPPPPRATSTERSFPAVVAPRPPTLAGVDTDDEERPMVVPEREALETPRGIGPSAEGLGLGAAIDEILQDMPSSAPARPVDVEIAASEASARAKALGDLPPSPPPLKATLPGAEPSPPPPDTSPDGVEGRIEHTLVMRSPSGGQEAPTVRPPPELIQETTAMMRRIDVAAGPHRGAAPGNDADTARPPPPPPVGGTAPLAQPVSSGGGATAPLATPIAPTTGPSGDLGPPPESYGLPGARPLGPTIAISFAVVALVAACVIGVVTYVRWKEASTEAPIALPAATNAPAPSVASARPSSTAKVAPPSAASAVASVAASASVAPGASETPAASAAASASASAPSTPTLADLPAGSGLVKTEGAPPGRRIFVDDRTVGQTPESVVVKCGTHQIKIGSAGTARAVDVPCGGEIVVH